MLKIKPGVDLGCADVRVTEQFLHRAQVAAGLQQVAGKGVTQHVRCAGTGAASPGLLGCAGAAAARPTAAVARLVPWRPMNRATGADAVSTGAAQGQTTAAAHPAPGRQPVRCDACRPCPARMGIASLQIDPAARLGAGCHIQANQLPHRRPLPYSSSTMALSRALNQGASGDSSKSASFMASSTPRALGRGLPALGDDICTGSLLTSTGAPHPGVKAPPAGQNKGNAPPAAALGMHLSHPAPHMVVLHLVQRHAGGGGSGRELLRVQRIQLYRARLASRFSTRTWFR